MLRTLTPALAVLFLAAAVQAQQLPTLQPAAGDKNVCPDTPLKITLATTARLGTGKIEVCDAADDKVAATVDVAQPTRTQAIGGLDNYVVRPVLLSGNDATICLPPHSLANGKTYYVKIVKGVLANDPIADSKDAWRFSTKAAPPAADAKQVTVAPDGTGDFATIQGAIDFFPEGNTAPRTIVIQPGTYNEILCVLKRDNLTFLGQDRKKTLITYANNDRFNPNAGGNPFGAGAPQPGAADPKTNAVYRRGVFLAHQTHGLTLANLTIRNTTPKGGSQAETIILNGMTDARTVLTNLDLYSLQDTVQFNGQTYIHDCYIEGDVDFMWGTGPCYFDQVHARAASNGAIYTTVRTPPPPNTNHGFVFKDCTFDGAPNVTGAILARIEANRFPTSETILLNTTMSAAVAPAGWRAPTGGDASNIHYWEYKSHDADGKPIDIAQRLASSKQLTEPADHDTIVHYSDPKWVLGGDWTPALPKLP
jgi:pectin methylesterase-like acyl-CoA thioesterase